MGGVASSEEREETVGRVVSESIDEISVPESIDVLMAADAPEKITEEPQSSEGNHQKLSSIEDAESNDLSLPSISEADQHRNRTSIDSTDRRRVLGKRGIGTDRTISSSEETLQSQRMKGALSTRLSAPLSWRPNASTLSWMPLRTTPERKHTDPKRVYEGLRGLSMRAALDMPAQIVELLTCDINSGERYDNDKRRERYDVNQRDSDGDRFPLHWAAARGNLRCVQELLKAGADVSVLDASGITPAELALACDQGFTYECLVYGPSLPDTKPITGKEGPLSTHCALLQDKQLTECFMAIAKDDSSSDDPNKRDADGDRYPLHWAAARGSTKCIRVLLDKGAILGVLDAEGHTAAALALAFNQRTAHALLMQAIADAPTSSNTPPPTPPEVASRQSEATRYDKKNDVPRAALPKGQHALLPQGSPLLPGVHEPYERDLALSLDHDVEPVEQVRQLL